MYILALLLHLFTFPSNEGGVPLRNGERMIAEAEYLSPDEKAMIWEINFLREEPLSYVEFLKEYWIQLEVESTCQPPVISESIKRKVRLIDGQERIEIDTQYIDYYKDKKKALCEALMQLDRGIGLPFVAPKKSLYQAAINHGDSQVSQKYIDHRGADGSWPLERNQREDSRIKEANENIIRHKGNSRDIVLQLLIDSGVPHRGHRKNLLNVEWRWVACHHVRQLDKAGLKWWIQEFAH